MQAEAHSCACQRAPTAALAAAVAWRLLLRGLGHRTYGTLLRAECGGRELLAEVGGRGIRSRADWEPAEGGGCSRCDCGVPPRLSDTELSWTVNGGGRPFVPAASPSR